MFTFTTFMNLLMVFSVCENYIATVIIVKITSFCFSDYGVSNIIVFLKKAIRSFELISWRDRTFDFIDLGIRLLINNRLISSIFYSVII